MAQRRLTRFLEHQTLRVDAAGIDVIGGGAASDTWLALLADILGVPVRRRCGDRPGWDR